MSDRTILQVPLSTALRSSATKVAKEQGYSSLQEVVRVFLSRLSNGNLTLELTEHVKLTPRAKRRFDQAKENFEQGKGVTVAHSAKELLQQLHDD